MVKASCVVIFNFIKWNIAIKILLITKVTVVMVKDMAKCATCVFHAFILLKENARGTFGHVVLIKLIKRSRPRPAPMKVLRSNPGHSMRSL